MNPTDFEPFAVENGVVCAVGEPQGVLNGDGLRILRALRFASACSLGIDGRLSESIHANRGLLNSISVERANGELTGILVGAGVFEVLRDYADVFEKLIPEIGPMVGFEQRTPYHKYDVWTHTIRSVDEVRPEPDLRLAMLFHDMGKPAAHYTDENGIDHFKGHATISEEIARSRLKALKYGRDTVHTVAKLIEHHDARLTEANAANLLEKLGPALICKLIEVQAADAKAQADEHRGERLEALRAVKFIVDNARGECPLQ